MKIKYEFADGTVLEVEVEESIGAVIIESRREEDNLARKERYHCYSMDAVQFEGNEYGTEETPETQMERKLDIAGHSLGGAMAANYAATHSEDYGGLILLAAYSTKNLTQTSLRVLSIYGSEDGVLNRESYEKNWANLPADATEVILEGGCHAQFGGYGPQDGDGTPTGEEPIRRTAGAIAAFTVR